LNGVHDMGGMHGMGPVVREPDEPIFHHEWERRVLALTLACGALRRWNLDMSRHTRELMPAAGYLASSYYERWLWGLERLLATHGLLAPGEIERRMAAGESAAPAAPAAPLAPAATPGLAPLRAAAVPALVRAAGHARVRVDAASRTSRSSTMNGSVGSWP